MDQPSIFTLCDALIRLMDPLLEIAVHDLEEAKIIYIGGHLSNRKVGDPSMVELASFSQDDIPYITYPKLNYDGRLIKSISVPLERRWLICINCDVSIFSEMNAVASSFLKTSPQGPESLFKDDWQERLHVSIHSYLKERSWRFNHLKSSEKKEVIFHLLKSGAFKEKKAPDYVAQILSMGRATIFNYLKEWKNHEGI